MLNTVLFEILEILRFIGCLNDNSTASLAVRFLANQIRFYSKEN